MARTYGAAIAKQTASASALFTTSGKAAMLHGYAIQFGTSSQASVTFRDGASNGTIRWVDSNIAVTAAGDKTGKHNFSVPIPFSSGIFVVLTGTNTKITIQYTEAI